ncbi:undecaprenyl-diphosphatase [Aliiruegeria haliotis]|uniref:Undecaprenyl-diphosphatase n=2 Tax=Aliiruegeria haliotis TaxID=1280846 RepID=A0A2T0RTK3_9RHOB|nr:undecaprenyl-diphosphatase [Aliiruegeria haliotis]
MVSPYFTELPDLMTLFNILLVAIIQGLTEFLPVSSSGHLILLPNLTGLDDQGLTIDVATHVGTLFAVILYFWSDVKQALGGIPRLLRGKIDTPGARLAFLLIVATVPVILVGLVLKVTGLADAMRSTAVIGWTMLIFGLVLYWADQKGEQTRHSADWTLRDAIIMGLWQAVALIPGTSRSGITITGARQLGYAREDAARLAMLMSIPTIIASGTLLGIDVVSHANWAMARDASIAAALAFAAALLALSLMMRLLRSVSFTPYVIYRVMLGLGLLAMTYL